MIQGKYLSEIIDPTLDIETGVINLISTNCGSGKTTFALNKLPELVSSLDKILYVIDTCAGRDQLLKNENTKSYDKEAEMIINGEIVNLQEGKIVIMTYAKLGTILKNKPNFLDNFELIVCDEFHKLYDILIWDCNKIKKQKKSLLDSKMLTKEEVNAQVAMESAAYQVVKGIQKFVLRGINPNNKSYVVALSATPDKLKHFSALNDLIQEIKIDSETVAYEVLKEQEYISIGLVIANLKPGTRGIIFTSRITDMENFLQMAEGRGFRCKALWSVHNKGHVMTEEQLKIRRYIIENQEIPDDIDILFINKSYETGINIFTQLSWMIIHDSDRDTQTQVKDRVRCDLPELWIYNPHLEEKEFELPLEWLDKPLFKQDKDELCELINVRLANGKQGKWTTIKKNLIENGYKVTDKIKTTNGKRESYSLITL